MGEARARPQFHYGVLEHLECGAWASSRPTEGLKLERRIRPASATLEQSFPPRNSTGKVSCCVVVVVERSFSGVSLQPDISGSRC
jgi:hypothetical protein